MIYRGQNHCNAAVLAAVACLTVSTAVCTTIKSGSTAEETYTAIFPTNTKVADFRIAIPAEFLPGTRGVRVAAQGRVTLPKKCDINVNLTYDGVNYTQTLNQIDENQIVRFSAAQLELTDDAFMKMKPFKRLKQLNLENTLISDKSLTAIARLTSLAMLRVNATDITGSGFDQLSQLKTVWNMDISGLRLKPGSLAKLKPLAASIGDLDVARDGLTLEDAKVIGQMTHLRALHIGGNKLLTNESVKYFRNLVNLASLYIEDTSINYQALPDLYKLPALKKVSMRAHQFWPGGNAQATRPGILFVNRETNQRMEMEIFDPLH